MVDQERVRLMTRLAKYENGEGVEDFRIRKYYRSDYTALQLIKTWILTTLGYGLLLGLVQAEFHLRVDSGHPRSDGEGTVRKIRTFLRSETGQSDHFGVDHDSGWHLYDHPK